jgi:hypothetical protein
MALSDMSVRQAKATGTAYTLGDIDGLSLNVSAHDGKSWHFRYYWAGKQKRISLGTYPEVSLRQARQARDEARTRLAEGTNPKGIANSSGRPSVWSARTRLPRCSTAGSNVTSDPKKCISRSALNEALRYMGYAGRLTGHGLRGTLSTALNEIGYPKAWVDRPAS